MRIRTSHGGGHLKFPGGAGTSTETVWTNLHIGAGGFLTGLDIHTDGTKVTRTDTYGAYRWDNNIWTQIVTMQSMPSAFSGRELFDGVNEIRIAPSNSRRFYMNYSGNMFRSDDRGVSWTNLSNYATVSWSINSVRAFAPYIAVDPANADVVYASTPSSGLRVSTDAGATWSTVSAVGTGGDVAASGVFGGHLIAFDPTSSVVGSRTQGIYVSTYGTGVYHSTDGGTNWTLTTGTQTTHYKLVIGQDGVVYYCTYVSSENIYIYNGSWTAKATDVPSWIVRGVAVDPANPNNITTVVDNGSLSYSSDHGATWTGYTQTKIRVAADIPWIAWTLENYMSCGDIRYDPTQSNKLYFSEGIGMWTTAPNASVATSVTYTSQSLGIEQLVSNDVVSPPGGNAVVSFWDRPVFYVSDPLVYPSTHGAANPLVNSIVSGWSIDYASSDPTTIVIMARYGNNESGYSTDGGRTWTAFVTSPADVGTTFQGAIAAASATNFVWVSYINHGNIYYTTDKGVTWNASTVPGVPTSGETGWGNTFSNFIDRRDICADRVLPNTFYAYNIGLMAGGGGFEGVYKSTDGGANYSKVHAGLLGTYGNDGFNGTLRSVPGFAGHLYWSGGQQGGGTAVSGLTKSTDGGVTWTPVPGVAETYSYGFGMIKSGASYPTLFVAGFVGGTAESNWGIWRSTDADQATPTWTRISDGYPLGNFSLIKTVSGDMNRYGTVYVGTSGAGFLYGKLN